MSYIIFISSLFIIAFWLFTLFLKPIFRIVTRYLHFASSQENGHKVDAKIIESRYLRDPIPGTTAYINTTIEFLNFADTLIKSSIVFQDTKPELRRFEIGKSMPCILNPNEKNDLRLQPAGAIVTLSLKLLIPLLLALIGTLTGIYFVMRHAWNLAGSNWNQLSQSIQKADHLPGFFLMYIGITLFVWLIFKWIGKQLNRDIDDTMRYFGTKTMAKISKVEQTHTEVGHKHQVSFNYSFMDTKGKTHKGEDHMLVELIDLGSVRNISEKEIYYLLDSPEISALAENVDASPNTGNGTTTILNGPYYFMIMIFSVILLWQIYRVIGS